MFILVQQIFHNPFYKKVLAFVVFFNCMTIPVFCQNYSVWTFGKNISLDFKTEPAGFSTNAMVANGYKRSSPSSICDSSGNLVLYSDGTQIFNRYDSVIQDSVASIHELIPQYMYRNIFLQSSLNPDIYFFFYISVPYPLGSANTGFFYEIIDVSANNGKAKVLQKNIQIEKDTFLSFTVVRHINKKDFWFVLLDRDDSFHIYSFNSVNVSKKKVIIDNNGYRSNKCLYMLGTYQEDEFSDYLITSTGCNKIYEIYSFQHKDRRNPCYNGYKCSFIREFDFNNSTGDLKPIRFVVEDSLYNLSIHDYYEWGAALSPNDSIMYLSNYYENSVVQYNLKNDSFFTYPIARDISPMSSLKLAPNGKIYMLQNQPKYKDSLYLSIINYPDKFGTECKLEFFKIKLTDSRYSQMLPNILYENLYLGFDYNICNKNRPFINKSNTALFKEFTWYVNDKDSVSVLDLKFNFNRSGKVPIRLRGKTISGYTRLLYDTINYLKPPESKFHFTQKSGCQWVAFQFSDSSYADTIHPIIGQSWLWDFGDGASSKLQNPSHIYTKVGKYDIKLKYSNGYCEDSIIKPQAVEILAAPKPGFTVNSSNNCSPFLLKITDNSQGAVQKWVYSFGNGTTDSIPSPECLYKLKGNYIVKQLLTSYTGCVTQDSQLIHIRTGFDTSYHPVIFTASFKNNKAINISWPIDSPAFSYQIFRGRDKDNFSLINSTQSPYYTDSFNFNVGLAYTYKIKALDSCDKASGYSKPVTNIVLSGSPVKNDFAIITWTAFEEWQNGVLEYIVEVKDTNSNFVPIANLSGNQYRDNNYYDSITNTEKCYRIKAVENAGNNQVSISNELCFAYQPMIWVPNAFSPNNDNLNDVFRVITMGITEIKISIYSRWGEKVFESNNTKKSWDGKINGKQAEMGSYLYSIKAKSAKSEEFSFKGILTLIR